MADKHVVIIGNGISGITTARWVRKLTDHKITVISSEHEFFFSRTALMYIYMGHMRMEDTQPYEKYFWKKNRIDLIKGHVEAIDFNSKHLLLQNGQTIDYNKLVLGLGSKSNKFGWPGQDLNKVSGLYHLQDLQNMERYSKGLKRAVIVGGGLIGIEMAEMFASRNVLVSMLVREKSYWDNILPPEESQMITRHIRLHHIDLRLGVNLEEIVDDGEGNASAVIIKETGEKIDCGYVGLTAGVSPNVGWLKDSDLEIDRGILVDEHLETNIQGVFAVGDCVQLRNPRSGRRNIEAVWYTGRMMGETAAYNLCGKPIAYNPGIWFNSAKFLDIEYQVYGDVRNHVPDDQESIYWEHPEGNKSVRINFNKQSNEVTGFNLMGIRWRHEVCEKWINESANIHDVLTNLHLADFDPEFYNSYATDVVSTYNDMYNKSIGAGRKSSLTEIQEFLSL